jgi:hypothetical protein
MDMMKTMPASGIFEEDSDEAGAAEEENDGDEK